MARPKMRISLLKYNQGNTVASLTTLNSVFNRLKNPKKIVNWIGILTYGKLLKNWPQGKGGNDRRMPILTPEYKEWKVKHGGHGIANLNFDIKVKRVKNTKKGKKGSVIERLGATSLYKSMTVKNISKYRVAVGPADAGNNKKLKYLLEKRPSAMRVSKRFKNKMKKEARELIFQGL
jgi:hypothetical protein